MCLCHCSGLVITMVVSLLFILLLRYTASVLLWLTVFGVFGALNYGECAPQTATHIASSSCIHVGDAAHIFILHLCASDSHVWRHYVYNRTYHSCERDVSETPWGTFLEIGRNVKLHSKMNWLDSSGQRSRSLTEHIFDNYPTTDKSLIRKNYIK